MLSDAQLPLCRINRASPACLGRTSHADETKLWAFIPSAFSASVRDEEADRCWQMEAPGKQQGSTRTAHPHGFAAHMKLTVVAGGASLPRRSKASPPMHLQNDERTKERAEQVARMCAARLFGTHLLLIAFPPPASACLTSFTLFVTGVFDADLVDRRRRIDSKPTLYDGSVRRHRTEDICFFRAPHDAFTVTGLAFACATSFAGTNSRGEVILGSGACGAAPRRRGRPRHQTRPQGKAFPKNLMTTGAICAAMEDQKLETAARGIVVEAP